uniref:ATP synthase F0 subunit 8 n=1 Tax=Stegophiura sladeni TaxID=2694858 RepID=UPI002E77EF98|nr:ATP synthase F0 subunit 8 [Stegophiura sladeni]UFQ25367.1 ATP synthase F0 subunit 8 [Stegophiura sladeni]
MPQLDFTIWLINLFTCWSMFSLIIITTNNITSSINLNNKNSHTTNTNNILWNW